MKESKDEPADELKFNPFGSQSYVLVSRLSPEECAKRLDWRVEPWRFPAHMFAPPDADFIGKVSDRGFSIYVHRRFRRQSFSPVARGTFTTDGTTTRIDVHVGLSRFVVWFMLVWIGFFLIPWLVGVLAAIVDPVRSPMPTPILLLFAAFGVALSVIGRVTAADQESVLLQMLREDLQAEDAEPKNSWC